MFPVSYQFVASGMFQRFAKPLLYSLGMAGKEPAMNPSEYKNLKALDSVDWNGQFVRVPIVIDHPDMSQPLTIEECVMSVTQSKNIVKTVVPGLDGTIKEYSCKGDYEITMQCAVTAVDANGNQIDEYPTDGIRAAVEMCDVADSLEVSSWFLRDVFGITSIVISEYSIEQQTYSNRQEISINASSDMEYVIKSEQI